jgi:hypothetical protein
VVLEVGFLHMASRPSSASSPALLPGDIAIIVVIVFFVAPSSPRP